MRRVRIQTGDKVVQHGGECVPLHWRIDTEQRQAVIKAVKMVREREYFFVPHHSGIVNTVAKVKAAVGDRCADLVDAADRAIVVGNIFHKGKPPFSL